MNKTIVGFQNLRHFAWAGILMLGATSCLSPSVKGSSPTSSTSNGSAYSSVPSNTNTTRYVFPSAGNYTQISDWSTGNLDQCSIDSTTGALESCVTPPFNPAFQGDGANMTFVNVNGTTYAYGTEFGPGLFQCNIDPTSGNFNNCVTASGGISSMYTDQILPVTMSGKSYLYFGSGNFLYACALDPTTGVVDPNCASDGWSNGGGIYWGPGDLAFDTDSNGDNYLFLTAYLYVGGYMALFQCSLDSGTGAIGSCVTLGPDCADVPNGDLCAASLPSGLSEVPSTISSTTIGSTTYLYMDDNICSLDGTGTLSCVPNVTGNTVDSYYSSNGLNFALVSDSGGNEYQCTVDNSGNIQALGSCATFSGGNMYSVEGIYTTTRGHTYSYGFDQTADAVDQCVNTAGAMSNCNTAGLTPSWNVTGLATASFGGTTYEYLSDYTGNGNIWQCQLTSSGLLTGICLLTYSTFWPVLGDVPATITMQTFNGTTYAYLTGYFGNWSHGASYQCTLDNVSGAITSCAFNNANMGMWQPKSISFGTVGHTTYAYLTTATDLYQCAIDPTTGHFTTCSISDGGNPNGWPGASVTINTFGSGSFAYVSDGANLYRCPLNPSTGALENCGFSNGGAAWNPSSITFSTSGGNAYAYANDQSTRNVWQCQVDANSGIVSNCQTSNGGMSWDPRVLSFTF